MRIDGPTRIALACIVITAAVIWLDAARQSWVPCVENCGEGFDVFKYVKDYRLYGLRHGMLHDQSHEPDPDRQPILYTHNVNAPGMLWVALEVVGLTAFWQKQAATLLATAAGLLYAFLAVRLFTRSAVAALSCLVLFCTEYELVYAFALNAYRAWHWLAIFGLLYHLGRLVRDETPSPGGQRVTVALFAALAFGLGYDFLTVVGMLAFVLLAGLAVCHGWLRALKAGTFVLVGAGSAVALRQIQVATVLGVDYWWKDLHYSAAIKIPFLVHILGLPPLGEVEAFYAAHSIWRPGAAPPTSWSALGNLASHYFVHAMLPITGALSWSLMTLLAVLAIGWLIARALKRCQASTLSGLDVDGTTCLLVALTVGGAAGMVVFMPLTISIYIKHKVALLAAPLLVAKASAIGVALPVMWRSFWRPSSTGVLAGVAAMLLVFDHLVIQIHNVEAARPLDLTWVAFVRQHPDATFAITWNPENVSYLVSAQTVMVDPTQRDRALDRFDRGELAFRQTEYRAGPSSRRIGRPDYLLALPTEETMDVDTPTPRCRQDWLLAAFSGAPPASLQPVDTWVSPAQARPGATVSFGGKLAPRFPQQLTLTLDAGTEASAPVVYNCRFGQFFGVVTLPADVPPGFHSASLTRTHADGSITDLGTIAFTVDPTVPPVPAPPAAATSLSGVQMRYPDLSLDQIVAAHPNIPIAERGRGYVIFDVRPREPGSRNR